MIDDEPPRWTYRLEAYRRALSNLDAAVRAERDRGLSDLEKMGLIQGFEITVELGWKLLKDVLEAGGQIVTPPVPNAVVRAAFEANLIADGRGWLEAIKLRNSLSHVYREEMFMAAIPAIIDKHYPVLSTLPHSLASPRAT